MCSHISSHPTVYRLSGLSYKNVLLLCIQFLFCSCWIGILKCRMKLWTIFFLNLCSFLFADITSVAFSWFHCWKDNSITWRIIFSIEWKSWYCYIRATWSMGTKWSIQRRKRENIMQVNVAFDSIYLLW